MTVNKRMLPIKGHFFLFNAGTAPLVPYLSTYARQLGFSSATVGLIYTVLPIFGLIAKPLFGIIADRFKKQKPLFLLFQVLTLLSFAAIYFIPENQETHTVRLDCGDGVTEIRSCFSSADKIEGSKISTLEQSLDTQCNMNCDMTSPKMWQTVCEHWHLPKYCYSHTKTIQYSSIVSNIIVKDNCTYISASNVTLDGHQYTPKCRIGNGFVDVDVPCNLSCSNKDLMEALGTDKPRMTCVNNMMHYHVCKNNVSQFAQLAKAFEKDECQVTCDLDPKTPWRLMEICEGWGADAAGVCHPRSVDNASFPHQLSFVGTVQPKTVLTLKECVYMQLHQIQLPRTEGTNGVHYPYCVSKAQYQLEEESFHTPCQINCDNQMVNELIQQASDSNSESSQYTREFWLFFLFMSLSWIGMAVVVTFADAICFVLLGDRPAAYGKQRLWGSVGWGIFSLATGALIDVFSDGGPTKNYTIAFIFMAVFMLGDIVVSCLLNVDTTKMSVSILADVGTLFASLHTFTYMMWTIVVGLCTGLIWQFLFWHLEDIANSTADGSQYTKTLQGLVSAVQTFGGEIPFMFVSGFILKKIGHVNMMSLVLFAFGVRFILYSVLTNAWWVLPIEMLQGITFGMFYPTMTSYANVVSPPGTETTVQGLVGAIFEGVGTSLGSLIGGYMYEKIGGWKTFQWFGLGSLLFCVIHIIIQYLIKDKEIRSGVDQGKGDNVENGI